MEPDNFDVPPPKPSRQFDTVALEELEDLIDPESPHRGLVKSRDFPEMAGLDITPREVQVVLFDCFSIDSFAGCVASKRALGAGAHYVGVHRSQSVDSLQTADGEPLDVTEKVVAMVGVCWSMEAIHEMLTEVAFLFVLETHESVARELGQLSYPSLCRILDPAMGAGALAWNFFLPGEPVPPLLRALEDSELGRHVLKDSAAFADGLESYLHLEVPDFEVPRGEVQSNGQEFAEFEYLLDDGGRATIKGAIDEGIKLQPTIKAQCEAAAARHSVKMLRMFPAWRCALVNVSSRFAGRIGEHLVEALAAENGGSSASRCIAIVYEVQLVGHRHGRAQGHVRAVLRSQAGGADVSELAALEEGFGHPSRAFFSIAQDVWEELWTEPDVVLWDVPSAGPHCLPLKRGALVTIARRGERFRDSPSDEWSFGYCCDAPAAQGWIPTLAHTLLIATVSIPSAQKGVAEVNEGDLVIGRGQKGQYIWGQKCSAVGFAPVGPMAWFPYGDGALMPVHAASVKERLAAVAGGGGA